MAPFQTDYSQYPVAGVAGMKVDSRDDTVESYAAEGAIGFGLAVVAGTDTAVQVKVGSGTLRGIALRTSALARQSDGTSGYADEDAVNVGRKCVAWAPIFEDVAIDGAVTFNTTSGLWGSGTGTAVPGGRWRSTQAFTSGAVAKLELVLPAVVS